MQAVKRTDPTYSQVARYELFDSVITKDINGNDVTIPKSLGVFTTAQLESIKTRSQDALDEAQTKLDAINEIINS